MFSSMRSVTGESEARRPQSPHRYTRVILMLAWAVFWLNSALLPCCEVVAAALGGHADNGSQSISAAQPAHHSDTTHSEPLEHSTDSPCGDTLVSGIPIVGGYEVLTPDRSPLDWFAVDVRVATSLTAITHSTNLVPREYPPPPPFRLYLHTQRLLI